ncbi:MAG: hypothetical protein K0R00_3810 [Herbinix sp.]|jgi:hypothetical protein|nr:hypothetical protein [Herbinix sp.]
MYFEPSKKSYYRFPSINSVHQMDSRNYFPEKPYASGENNAREVRSNTNLTTSEHNSSFK